MTQNDFLLNRSAVSVAVGLTLVSCIAHAQTSGAAAPTVAASTPEATKNGAEGSPGNGTPDTAYRVVVTAQKRPQFADKVPMSLSAITQDDLQREGVTDYKDLGRLSPGLNVTAVDQMGQAQISIRGIASQSGAATTALYIDDAPIQTRRVSVDTGSSAFPELFDLERVEVLRGPQGTLFGASAEGGAIRFITPIPRSATTTGMARVGIGATQGGGLSHDAGVAVGGSLDGSTDLLYRVSGDERHEGGYIDAVDRTTGEKTAHNINRSDSSVFRGVVQWRPVANLTITPSLFYQDLRQADRNVYYEEAGQFNTYNKLRQPSRDRFSLSSLSVNYDTDSLSFKSVTSYYNRGQRRTDDDSYVVNAEYAGSEVVPGLEDHYSRNVVFTGQQNLSQEFRISSNDDPDKDNWVAGLYLAKNTLNGKETTEENLELFTQTVFGESVIDYFGSPTLGPNGEYAYLEHDHLQDRSFAVFGEYSHKFGPQTTLTAGLRLGRNTYGYAASLLGPWVGGAVYFDGSHTDTSVLPKLSLSHELSADDMVYATAATGDRPGAGNLPLAGFGICAQDLANLGIEDVPHAFKSDKLISYELGYKGRMFGRTLDVASSLFFINWKQIQTRITLPTCGFGYIANAGRATSTGGDVQLQLHLSSAISLSASASYTDAKYKKTIYPDSAGADEPIVRNGQALPVPKVTATLGVEYAWTPVEGKRAYVRADDQFTGGYARTGSDGIFAYDASVNQARATNTVALNAGLRSGPYEWTASIYNLLNSRTELVRSHYTPTDTSYQAATFRPRTLNVDFTYKF